MTNLLRFLTICAYVVLGATVLAEQKEPIPVQFRAAPVGFIANGKEQGPNIVVSPVGATFAITGTVKAEQPGKYSFTATATGRYVGSITCSWTILPGGPESQAVRRENGKTRSTKER